MFLPVPDLLPGSFLLIFPSAKQKRLLKTVYFTSIPYFLAFNTCLPSQYKHISSPDSLIQLPRMVEKIFFLLASSISVKDRKLKWRVKRWVMGFRPPPGGPMAHAKLMSTMCLNVPDKTNMETNKAAQFNRMLLVYEGSNKIPIFALKDHNSGFRNEEILESDVILLQSANPKFTIFSPICFLSYQPPWSIHCLNSSMGG